MIHKKQKQKTALFLVQVIVIIINTLLFAAIWYGYYKSRMWGNTFYGKGDALVVALYFIIYTIMAQLYKGLALRISRISELIYSQCVSILISNCIIYIVIMLLTRHVENILPLLLEMVISCVLSTIWSIVANKLTNIIYKPSKVLLAYDNQYAYKNGRSIIDRLSWRFILAGEIKLTDIESWHKGAQVELQKFVNKLQETGADSVMLCGLASTQRNDIIKYCVEHDIKTYVRPNIGDFMISNAQVIQMANLPVMICERATPGLGLSLIHI